MTTWQQQYPGQGAPPPAGFQIPTQGYPNIGYPQQPGYPNQGQPGYPPPLGYPPQAAFPDSHFITPEMYGTNNEEAGAFVGSGFDDKSIRRAFIRKVYSILTCQVLLTIALMAPFLFHEPTKMWAQKNSWITIVVFIMLFIVLMVLACCGEVRRKYPMNVILLGTFTALEGFTLGVICASYDVVEVMIAMGITAVVCLALTLFALQTKWDFTMMGTGLLIAVVVLFLFGLLAMVLNYPIMHLLYACGGAIIFSLYLVYDTQLMMGGDHKYSISPEEYVFAALNLYVDIINLFLMILRITSYSRS